MSYKKEILLCECNSTEHQMVFLYDTEDKEHKMVYVHVHLNKKPFLERLKYGIKYIFGYQSKYGAFDEFIFNPDDYKKLKDVLRHIKDK